MNLKRKITGWGEAFDTRFTSLAPWLLGFSLLCFIGHLLTALVKGWL